MSKPSLQAILNCFHKYPHMCNTPGYVLTYMIPGGVRNLDEGLGFYRAVGSLDQQDPVTVFKVLGEINAALTHFQKPLDTHDPEWKVTGNRSDGEVYYYPRCPKGYPLERLHELVYEGNEEQIKRLDELIKSEKTWFDVLETGKLTTEEKSKLFYEVSAKTHGTQGDFLLAWLKLQRECVGKVRYVPAKTEEELVAEKLARLETADTPETPENPPKEEEPIETIDTLKVDPILYAVKLHDLIISHMPFVRANRRLARLLLCHTMIKGGFYPPMLWSGPNYEAKVTHHRLCDLRRIESEQDPKKKEELKQRKQVEFTDFLNAICAWSTEAESVFQRKPPAGERHLELWEILAMRGSPIQDKNMTPEEQEKKAFKDSICEYIKTRGRILIPDIICAMSIFTDVLGKEIMRNPEHENTWLWSGMSKKLKEAIEELVKEGLIKWSFAAREEYEAIRNVPEFGSDHDVASWVPRALKPAKH
jgi:hypothetical protein